MSTLHQCGAKKQPTIASVYSSLFLSVSLSLCLSLSLCQKVLYFKSIYMQININIASMLTQCVQLSLSLCLSLSLPVMERRCQCQYQLKAWASGAKTMPTIASENKISINKHSFEKIITFFHQISSISSLFLCKKT